MELEAMSRLT